MRCPVTMSWCLVSLPLGSETIFDFESACKRLALLPTAASLEDPRVDLLEHLVFLCYLPRRESASLVQFRADSMGRCTRLLPVLCR